MSLYDPLSDRETKTCSTTRSRLIHLIEAIEHSREILIGDADTRVIHFNDDLSAFDADSELDAAGCRRELNSVIEQDQQDAS